MTAPPPPPDLIAEAAHVEDAKAAQNRLWDAGFTRRRFLAGAGMAGAAVFASQLVTTRRAFAAPGTSNGNTVISVFLRGGADGLRMLVPASSSLGLDTLLAVRPDLVPGATQRIALSGANGWAANAGLGALMPFWNTNELAFVPAVTSPGSTRSHFSSQRAIECGSTDTQTSGWLERALATAGPGTTFRAVSLGSSNSPMSLAGPTASLALRNLKSMTTPSWSGYEPRTLTAIQGLYRGLDGSAPVDAAQTVATLQSVTAIRAGAGAQNGAVYPTGDFSTALADTATLLRAEVGLQAVTIDVGGWDTHTMEAADLDSHLTALSASLAAFMKDLGPVRRSRVTIVVITEFGRRVAQNASKGSDHGLGSVAMVLGGGLCGSGVFGRWDGVAAPVLDNGDVPGLNDVYDLMGEAVVRRLGVGSLSAVFPGHQYRPLGMFAAR